MLLQLGNMTQSTFYVCYWNERFAVCGRQEMAMATRRSKYFGVCRRWAGPWGLPWFAVSCRGFPWCAVPCRFPAPCLAVFPCRAVSRAVPCRFPMPCHAVFPCRLPVPSSRAVPFPMPFPVPCRAVFLCRAVPFSRAVRAVTFSRAVIRNGGTDTIDLGS
jgi:hypothetical protein